MNIFKWNGEYFGFVRRDYLFSHRGEYRGWIDRNQTGVEIEWRVSRRACGRKVHSSSKIR